MSLKKFKNLNILVDFHLIMGECLSIILRISNWWVFVNNSKSRPTLVKKWFLKNKFIMRGKNGGPFHFSKCPQIAKEKHVGQHALELTYTKK